MNFAMMMKYMPLLQFLFDTIELIKRSDEQSPNGKISKKELKNITKDLLKILENILASDLVD